MRRTRTSLGSRETHCGAILVVALICLLLVTVLAASLTRTALLQREQVIRDEWRLQAEWLADAGLDRAAASLNADAGYAGEQWRPELNQGGAPLGQVQIAIISKDSESEGRVTRINITADVPADTPERARVQRTTTIRVQD